MHVHRLDDNYVSDLPEREKKRHPFTRDPTIQTLLSTRALKKTDFKGPQMKLTKTITAVDVIRQATNMMNDRACRVAREIETHIDFNSDCSGCNDYKSPPRSPRRSPSSSQSSLSSSTSKSGRVDSSKRDTFDGVVEGYLNLIAGTLTVIIERGNNNVLCQAVEAVVAHLNFVDTLKLSLVRPLLTTYTTSSQVGLLSSKEGIAASFKCLLGHEIPTVLLFSNISTILALENVITAPCLAPIFYCYWACLRANLKEFAEDISETVGLPTARRQRYAALFRIAGKEMEVQESRLYLSRYNTSQTWTGLAASLSESDSLYSYTSSATSDSSRLEDIIDDTYSVASDARHITREDPKEVSFSLFRNKTPVLMSKLATVYENQEKQGSTTKRWSFLLKPTV